MTSRGAMYNMKMFLWACRRGVVDHSKGSTYRSAPDCSWYVEVCGLLGSCGVDCLLDCDRAHKRASFYHTLLPPHLQQHWSTALFRQSRCIPLMLPKQIQNEVHFLILINHSAPRFSDFFSLTKNSLSLAKIDCCLRFGHVLVYVRQ